jgi:hypothetical protein
MSKITEVTSYPKFATLILVLLFHLPFCFVSVTFDITLTSRLTTRPFQNLVAEMYLGEGAGGIKCMATRGGTADRYGRNADANSVGASWVFEPNKKVSLHPISNLPFWAPPFLPNLLMRHNRN